MVASGLTRGAVLAAAAVLLLAAGAEAVGKDVVVLSAKNFKEKVLESDSYWLVEFYAPWCGHCKNLEPEWAKAATQLKSTASLGAVDATVHSNLAQKYQVQGYPTIVEFGKNKKKHKAYQGPREAAGIVQYVQQNAAGFPAPSSLETVEFRSMYSLLSYTSMSHEKDTKIVYLHEGGSLPDSEKEEDSPSDKKARKLKKKKAKAAKVPKWFEALGSKVSSAVRKQQKAAKKAKKNGDSEALPPPPVSFATSKTQDEGMQIAAHLGLSADDLPAVVAFHSKRGVYNVMTGVSSDSKSEVGGFIRESLRGEGPLSEEEAKSMPVFPSAAAEARRERQKKLQEKKKADAVDKVQSLSAANAEEACFGKSRKRTCALVLPTKTGGANIEAKAKELAVQFTEVPLDFVYVVPSSQGLSGLIDTFHIDEDADGDFHLVLLKTKRKPRFVAHSGLTDATAVIDAFVDGSVRLSPVEGDLTFEGGNVDEAIEL